MSRLPFGRIPRRRSVLLDQALDQFFALGRAPDRSTQLHYRRAVRWLGETIGRPANVADLSDDTLRATLTYLTNTRRQTPATANGARKCLASLWRWCRDRGLITTGPTIPKLKAPARTPRAWTREELQRLVQAAASSHGTICGMPARVWWLALLALEWDTGCRAGELLALRWEWLDWSRGWLIVPAESRKGQAVDGVYGLMDDTLSLLRSMRQPEGLILGWRHHRSRYWQLWTDLLRAAGLPSGRQSKTQCLRRSFASHLAIGGGNAQSALGHASGSTTARHYLDPSITTRPVGESMPFRLLSLGDSTP